MATKTEIRKMNRDELNTLAEGQGLNPEDYSKADDLRDKLLESAEDDSNGDDQRPPTVPAPDVNPDPQSRALTTPAYLAQAGKLETVTHNKGRRLVNVAK